jgi:hypothetical protein
MSLDLAPTRYDFVLREAGLSVRFPTLAQKFFEIVNTNEGIPAERCAQLGYPKGEVPSSAIHVVGAVAALIAISPPGLAALQGSAKAGVASNPTTPIIANACFMTECLKGLRPSAARQCGHGAGLKVGLFMVSTQAGNVVSRHGAGRLSHRTLLLGAKRRPAGTTFRYAMPSRPAELAAKQLSGQAAERMLFGCLFSNFCDRSPFHRGGGW